MDRQPVLEGERLLLRPLREADWDELYAVASDKAIWAVHPVPDRWQELVFRAFFDEALAQGGALTVIDKHSSRLAGSSRFILREPVREGEIEIGSTFIARDLWGTGANAEIKRLMLAHALRVVPRVVFRVGVDNARSRAAMAKIGARLTDEDFVLVHEGRELPHVVYEVTPESFAAGPLVV